MAAHLWRGLVAWALAALLLAAPGAAQSPARIVAVGDLHGDYQAWSAIARAAGLVDRKGNWAGGRTVLVQTGDIVDRGPDSLRIIEQLMTLQRQAPRSGGRVVVLTGNHEAMMVIGDLRYVDPGEYRAFATRNSNRLREKLYRESKTLIEARYRARFPTLTPDLIRREWLKATPLGWVEHQLAWSPDGRLGSWAIGNPASVKIGDTLFVHGGLSAEYAALPLDEINRRTADALRRRDQSLTGILSDPLGPLWYRGNAVRTPDPDSPPQAQPAARQPVEEELTRVLAAHGARRMVIGHTPNLGGIAVLYGGRLVRIDTGISRFYGGRLAWLEILGDRLVPHEVPRPASTEVPAR